MTIQIPDLITALQKIETRKLKAIEAAERQAGVEVANLMLQFGSVPEVPTKPAVRRGPKPSTEVRNSSTVLDVPSTFGLSDRKEPPVAA
jgi:hypothetical protein